MTLRHIKIFLALCNCNFNTTKTAQHINMTQPAVSLAIKELEQYYNVALFDRIDRRLVITPAGRRFLEYANTIDHTFDDMEAEMKSWDKQGFIRVGATLTIGSKFLPIYAKKFIDAYPDIDIKGFCGPSNVLEEKILNNELEFAFSEGLAQHPSIVSEEYMDDHLIVFCGADSPYQQGQTISIEEFKNQKLVMREVGSGTRKVFDLACEKAGFYIEPVWESISNTGIINSVVHGIGIGVLSYRLLKYPLQKGYIKTLNVDGLDLNRKFYIIRHKDKKLSAAAKQFLMFCHDNNFEEK